MSKLNYFPPENIARRDMNMKYFFLAGSIEMGVAEDWQSKLTLFFNEHNIGTFNPRRASWDSSWVQSYETPEFFQQVTWEFDSLEVSDFIVLYLQPNTISPISLLELGLYARSGKIYIICPDGFWRKGNVEMTANRFKVPLFDTIDEFKKFFIKHQNRFIS